MARYVLAELNTHRRFSRNSASSRAIPTTKQIRRVLENPYMPLEWGKNKPGMSAAELLTPEEQAQAEEVWQDSVNEMALAAFILNGGPAVIKNPQLQNMIQETAWDSGTDIKILPFSVHKQIVNRLLEFAMYHTVLITSTEWQNFFALRISEHAQPDLRAFAEKALEAIEDSIPQELGENEWHMPYVDLSAKRYGDYDIETMKKVSTARSARLSYLNQEKHLEADDLTASKAKEAVRAEASRQGVEVADLPAGVVAEIENNTQNEIIDSFIKSDVDLHDNLVSNGHMSPLEHVARPFSSRDWGNIEDIKADLPKGHFLLEELGYHGNFLGWHQYRKDVPFESDFSHRTESELITRDRIQRALGGFTAGLEPASDSVLDIIL